jgi:8-amino-7-oxononanoate synthase
MKEAQTHHKSLLNFVDNKLQNLEAKNRRRTLKVSARSYGMQTNCDGRDLISFTDNDYLGLSTHPDVIKAATLATEKYGAGAGASRLVSGNNPLYQELEQKIAHLKGCEDAIVFGSGYMANIGIIPALIGKDDLIIADELVHTCIHSGISLSKATCLFFRHNDIQHARALLEEHRSVFKNALMIVDGVYSMDGDIAPLKELGELCIEHDTWLMNDDAHALGTIGGGKGSAAETKASDLVPLQMGTLSKAVGAYGGYLAGPKAVIDLMKSRARSLIYTTGLPPGTLAAAIKALDIIEHDKARVERPLKLARKFAAALDLPIPKSPIVPLIIGDEIPTLEASEKLANKGVQVIAFRPPTVPKGTCRLRFTFAASHHDSDIDQLIDVCRALKLGSESGE